MNLLRKSTISFVFGLHLVTSSFLQALTPRPEGLREEIQIAAGWRFQMDVADLGEKEQWFAGSFDRSRWGTVFVPKAWDLYDEALWGYEGIGWFTSSIEGRLARPGMVQKLHFGRVNYHTKAWLNGELLGENLGGYLPFEFDVSGKLNRNSSNVLVLRVDNRPRLDWLPAAKEIEWVQYGGVLAPVLLETTAAVFIADLSIQAVPRNAGASIACTVVVRNMEAGDQELVLRLGIPGLEASYRTVPLKLPSESTSVQNASLWLARANCWSPESPFLYPLTVTIQKGGRTLDRVTSRFGIREIETRGREILLNGKRLKLKGVNRYDEYGKYGPNAPRPLLVEDLRQMKRAGVNCIRMHYPQSPELLSLYDEMGFVVIEELPINWWGNGFSGKEDEVQNEGILNQAIPMLERMIRRDKNHPAIIIWSMSNESKTDSEVGILVMRKLIQRAKELDRSRLVTFVTDRDAKAQKAFEEADLVAVNVYEGQFTDKVAYHSNQLEELVRKPTSERVLAQLSSYPDKPMIVTEFGTRGVPTVHGDIHYTEEFQAAFIQAAWKALESIDELSGGVLWCWADYYHRRKFIQYAVFGPYGVVTVDRKPKAALRALATMYGGGVDKINQPVPRAAMK